MFYFTSIYEFVKYIVIHISLYLYYFGTPDFIGKSPAVCLPVLLQDTEMQKEFHLPPEGGT